ncbi:MAG: hypothetical protein AB1555_05000 [Nitrospirota bacterium]
MTKLLDRFNYQSRLSQRVGVLILLLILPLPLGLAAAVWMTRPERFR